MNMEGEWLAFREGTFEKEYWIHTTLPTGWVRTQTKKTGKWTYSGKATLQGAQGKARYTRVKIEKKYYKRHRLIALAKDGSAEALDKFRDWKNNPVEHGKRRREDERPDDSPENVDFGTHKTNRNDTNRKKSNPYASGHPVILKNATTGAKETFASATAAAAFLGAYQGDLSRYLNRKADSRMRMPKYKKEGTWDAAYDDFELPDAVRLARSAANLYLSPSRPNRLFRKLKTGKFCATELERRDHGYVALSVGGGREEQLHVLIVETLRPEAFESKLAKMPPGTTKKSLQVDHIDGDETNNAIDNLKVVDRSEHARKHAFEVEWLNARGKPIWQFACATDVVATVRGAKGQPLHTANVQKVCDGIQTHTGGQRFRWKDDALVKAKRAK